MSNSATRYGFWAITLHWLIATLVIWVGILGLLHDTWPKHSQAYWINLHALCGLALWLLLLWRAGLRIRHPAPPLPAEFNASTRRLANVVHVLLYVLLLITPILGMATFVWHGRDLDLGFYQIHFGVKKNRSIFEPSEDIHGYLAYGLFALIALHTLAALWHQFIKRDQILERMWWRQ